MEMPLNFNSITPSLNISPFSFSPWESNLVHPNRLNLPTRTPPSHPRFHSSVSRPRENPYPDAFPLLRRTFRRTRPCRCGFSGIFSGAADLQNGNLDIFTIIKYTQVPINELMTVFTQKQVFMGTWQKLNTRLQKHRETNKLLRTLQVFGSWVLIIYLKKLKKMLCAPLQ